MTSTDGPAVSRPRLAALLQLYALAIGAHAACAALQPQITALPGQATVLEAQAGRLKKDGPPTLGYFDALHAASETETQESQPPLPTLLSLSEDAGPGAHPLTLWSSATLSLTMTASLQPSVSL